MIHHVRPVDSCAHAGELDLDDLGAEVVQHGAGLSALNQWRQIQGPDSVKCTRHLELLFDLISV